MQQCSPKDQNRHFRPEESNYPPWGNEQDGREDTPRVFNMASSHNYGVKPCVDISSHEWKFDVKIFPEVML